VEWSCDCVVAVDKENRKGGRQLYYCRRRFGGALPGQQLVPTCNLCIMRDKVRGTS